MPIYEFECQACGHRFSQFYRSIRAAQEGGPARCPNCHGVDVQRVVSSFAVHGPARSDPGEALAERASAEKRTSITPKEQIDKWRGGKH
jgi:putative FmdB family regulatory protein